MPRRPDPRARIAPASGLRQTDAKCRRHCTRLRSTSVVGLSRASLVSAKHTCGPEKYFARSLLVPLFLGHSYSGSFAVRFPSAHSPPSLPQCFHSVASVTGRRTQVVAGRQAGRQTGRQSYREESPTFRYLSRDVQGHEMHIWGSPRSEQ